MTAPLDAAAPAAPAAPVAPSVARARPALRLGVYLVTDRAQCEAAGRSVAETAALAAAGGATVVQLREKDASAAEFLQTVRETAAVLPAEVALLVNDRVDVYLAARAEGVRVDGVHLGQSDLPVADVRRLVGDDAVIGLSASTPAELREAERSGAVDYLGIGALHPTATKRDAPPALGLDAFAALAAATPLPAVAIGGVTVDDLPALRTAGAAGAAVVSAVCRADDPRAAAAELAAAWSGAGAGAADAGEPAVAPVAAEALAAASVPAGDGPVAVAVSASIAAEAAAPGSAAPGIRNERPNGRPPRVLSIAGTDPAGGAGIHADLKAIAANGGYGMAAVTALVAQNTEGVRSVHRPPAAFLAEQLDAVSDDVGIDAVKIGMLADAELIGVVADWLDRVRPPVVVIDPVMVATSGDRLLAAAAEDALRGILGRADLVTPNLQELAVLARAPLAADWATALEQARGLAREHDVTVLAKGGHLAGRLAPDALVDPAGGVVELVAEGIETANTHGTGCSLSSALAALRPRTDGWPAALELAKAWLGESIRHGAELEVGRGNGPVHHLAGLWERGGIVTRPTPAELEREWRAGIAGTLAEIEAAPFVRGLADGTLAEPAFLRYLAQDAVYLADYARALAEASRLAPGPAAQAFWARSAAECLDAEAELHRGRLAGAALTARPDAATTAYLDHLLASAARGDYGVLVAAVLPCFAIYAELGERFAGALRPGHPYGDWIAEYSAEPFLTANRRALDLLFDEAVRATPERRARMREAFEASARHELAFFEAPLAAR